MTNASETAEDQVSRIEVPRENFVQQPAAVQERVHRAGVPASVSEGHELR